MSIADHARGSAGVLTDPAAATVLADTGALTGGDFGQRFFRGHIIAWEETGGGNVEGTIQHRNAGNNGNISTQKFNFVAGDTVVIPFTDEFANGERIRVVNDQQPGAGFDLQVAILGVLEDTFP